MRIISDKIINVRNVDRFWHFVKWECKGVRNLESKSNSLGYN